MYFDACSCNISYSDEEWGDLYYVGIRWFSTSFFELKECQSCKKLISKKINISDYKIPDQKKPIKNLTVNEERDIKADRIIDELLTNQDGRAARVRTTLTEMKESNKIAAFGLPIEVKPRPVRKPRTIASKESDRERYRCPGKTEARMFIYDYAREKLGVDCFNSYKHIVLASQECGDIDYLKGHRIPPKNIIACDIDPTARSAAEAWGVEVSPHDTIQETVPWAKDQQIGTINVDLTHTLPIGIAVLQEVLCHAPDTSIVSFTYLRGRDIFKSDSERLLYLTTMIGKSVLQFPYQSKTHSSFGSSMCVAIIER
jgi:hypothetical protein